MDAVTTAIIAAAGAGVTKLSEAALVDSYEALKNKIKQKFGRSKVTEAIAELEHKPDSQGRRAVLQEEITAAGVDADAEIGTAAQALLVRLQSLKMTEVRTVNVSGTNSIGVGGNVSGSTLIAGERTDAKS